MDQTMRPRAVNANGANVVRSGRCLYYGYKILGNAGAFTVTITDTKSGQALEPAVSVAAASEKVYPQPFECDGLTATMSGDPTDNLVLILTD